MVAAREIGIICKQMGAWLIYISTNYVFDGKRQLYDETSETRPVNAYGESKRASEVTLGEVCPDAAVFRAPLLYRPVEYTKETSVSELLAAVFETSVKRLC